MMPKETRIQTNRLPSTVDEKGMKQPLIRSDCFAQDSYFEKLIVLMDSGLAKTVSNAV